MTRCKLLAAITETAFGRSFCYRFFFALALSSGIPTQVVEPSVSRAAVLHGMAFTVLVEPSGATFVQAWTAVHLRQWTCGVWGWRCTGGRNLGRFSLSKRIWH
jgi:hypothetical protein